MKRVLLVCTLALAGAVAMMAACKQGEGERCQVDDDCSGGLVCNKAKNTCESTSGGGLDADVIDATPDAPPDTP